MNADNWILLSTMVYGGILGCCAGWYFGWAKGYSEGCEEYQFPRGTIRVNSTKDVDCEFTTEKANHEPS